MNFWSRLERMMKWRIKHRKGDRSDDLSQSQSTSMMAARSVTVEEQGTYPWQSVRVGNNCTALNRGLETVRSLSPLLGHLIFPEERRRRQCSHDSRIKI